MADPRLAIGKLLSSFREFAASRHCKTARVFIPDIARRFLFWSAAWKARLPDLAMSNFITDMKRLKRIAMDHGFGGIDWSFDMENLPTRPADESRWVDFLNTLAPLEIRFHCPFPKWL